jgi:regulator of sirC expression with transglutaminase-like and TPR domain
MRSQDAYTQGMRLVARNRLREGLEKLKEAIRFNPSVPEYHKDVGKVYFRLGDRYRGTWHYKKYLELWPDGPESSFIRSVVGR